MEALVICILVGVFFIETILSGLNQKHMVKPWPEEVRGIYTKTQVQSALNYANENFKFNTISKIVSLAIMLTLILEGGFNYLNDFVIGFSDIEYLQAVLFFGILLGANQIIQIPFSYYQTFVIEEKYGFNNSTKKIFFTDLVKSIILGAIIGGGLLVLFGWLIEVLGNSFWLVFWLVVVVIMIFVNAFYTSLILPLFNKLTPIEDEGLKKGIHDYCEKVNYKLTNLFQMDGSKRSKKANAFFSGLGPKKTIVLFDTLIEGQSESEIVAVLAHEIGHYKKKHTLINLGYGIAQLFVILMLVGFAINQDWLSTAIGVQAPNYFTGLLSFAILFSPISFLLGMIQNVMSRKMEFQADAYAKSTYDGSALVSALKKLSVDNLSNLNPHPAYVFFNYSHPPIHQRIKALK